MQAHLSVAQLQAAELQRIPFPPSHPHHRVDPRRLACFASPCCPVAATPLRRGRVDQTWPGSARGDLANLATMSLYGFEDYHGVDIGVVRALRLWYAPVAGELALERDPLQFGSLQLGH